MQDRQLIDGASGPDWVESVMAALAPTPKVRILRRTTVFGAFDHGQWGAVELLDGNPRQRVWTITARRTILASGALEQPICFPGNDRPGVMSASALRGYLNRYGVSCGRNPAIFTANDSGWRTAIDLAQAGVPVAAVVDVRADVDPALIGLLAPGTAVFTGAVVTGTSGRHGLTAISVRSGNATDRFLRLLRVTPSIRNHSLPTREERWRGFSSPNR